ncbi:hypothetical protein MAR_035879 [Mya arenaria]|uniref:Uncharacterized protein n=1 Tax=Mya arenaria TaxID=6604 RepID=A0ABY7ELD6_MYAAR|nr:hypothetical protein MAR_035879 [Mya arenaria]
MLHVWILRSTEHVPDFMSDGVHVKRMLHRVGMYRKLHYRMVQILGRAVLPIWLLHAGQNLNSVEEDSSAKTASAQDPIYNERHSIKP